MEGTYELTCKDKCIGHVRVFRQGLYYHFSCQCELTDKKVVRLQVRCGGKQENLGVLIPAQGRFCLEKTLPIKRLGQGTPEFSLVGLQERSAATFVPVYPDEPFAYIHKLEHAFLARQDGRLGVLIPQSDL